MVPVFHRPKIVLVEPREKGQFLLFLLGLSIKTDFRFLCGIFFSVKLVAFAACTLDFLLHSQPLSPFLSCLFSPAKIEVKWKNDYVTTGKIFMKSYLTSHSFAIIWGFFQDFKTQIDHKFKELKQKWNHILKRLQKYDELSFCLTLLGNFE